MLRHSKPVPRNNVISLPLRRVLLQVCLPRESKDGSLKQLKTLFLSPIGVYVASTQALHDKIIVRFDIAPEDIDFTIHTVIVTLPEAMIGPLERRRVANDAHRSST